MRSVVSELVSWLRYGVSWGAAGLEQRERSGELHCQGKRQNGLEGRSREPLRSRQ